LCVFIDKDGHLLRGTFTQHFTSRFLGACPVE
jgi:hypothetical protein